MERVTKAMLAQRAENLNRRLPADVLCLLQRRNGSVALDEYRGAGTSADPMRCVRVLTVGTSREVYDFLHAAMVGIDLSRS